MVLKMLMREAVARKLASEYLSKLQYFRGIWVFDFVTPFVDRMIAELAEEVTRKYEEAFEKLQAKELDAMTAYDSFLSSLAQLMLLLDFVEVRDELRRKFRIYVNDEPLMEEEWA